MRDGVRNVVASPDAISMVDRAALKQEIISQRGYWHPFHEGLLALDPKFLRAYLNFNGAPWKSGHLAPKVREFIYVAIDGSVTHLYERGMRRHMEHALALGASKEELLQVIEITTTIAHYTHELAAPILVEELKKARPEVEADIAELSEEQRRVKDEFIASTGAWPKSGDALLRFAPHFMEGFLSLRAVAWNCGPLAPKVKEFVGLAVCAAPTCLHEEGVRTHIQRAIQHGATPEEISEVLQLASAIAIHTCSYGVPALVEALATHEGNQA